MVETWDSIFKRSNKQTQLEDLLREYSTLQNVIDAEPLTVNNYINSFNYSSKSESPFPFWTADDLKNWYKTSEYYKKYKDFIRLRKSWEIDIVSNENHEFSVYYESSKKNLFLDKLIECSASLSQTFDTEYEVVFLSLEEEFLKSLTQEEKLILNASGLLKSDEVSLNYIYKKLIQHQLLQLFKSLLKNLKFDIKGFFRKIIQFLFKNMDDEAHANNLFDQKCSQKRLLIYLNKNKWIIKREFIISKTYSRILN